MCLCSLLAPCIDLMCGLEGNTYLLQLHVARALQAKFNKVPDMQVTSWPTVGLNRP